MPLHALRILHIRDRPHPFQRPRREPRASKQLPRRVHAERTGARRVPDGEDLLDERGLGGCGDEGGDGVQGAELHNGNVMVPSAIRGYKVNFVNRAAV